VKDEPRRRVVTFRLSEREYASLKSACVTDQISISSVARSTVLAWAAPLLVRPKVDQRLAEIDGRLDALCKLLSQNSDR
jgi:hypothetical protein